MYILFLKNCTLPSTRIRSSEAEERIPVKGFPPNNALTEIMSSTQMAQEQKGAAKQSCQQFGALPTKIEQLLNNQFNFLREPIADISILNCIFIIFICILLNQFLYYCILFILTVCLWYYKRSIITFWKSWVNKNKIK